MNYLALLKYVPTILKYLPYALLVAVLAGGSYYLYESGVKHEATQRDLKAATDRATELKASVDEYQQRVLETQKLAQTRTETNTVIRTVTKEILREIPVYLPATTPDLPGGFRLLHDAAATGTRLPDTPAPGSTDARPVPVADAASTVAANYGQYNALANDMHLLQQWVRTECTTK